MKRLAKSLLCLLLAASLLSAAGCGLIRELPFFTTAGTPPSDTSAATPAASSGTAAPPETAAPTDTEASTTEASATEAATSETDTPETTADTDGPEGEAAPLLAAAAETAAQMADYAISETRSFELTAPGESVRYDETVSLRVTGAGTDAMVAAADVNIVFPDSDATLSYSKFYVGGTAAYRNSLGDLFVSDSTPEAFLDTVLSPLPLTPGLYARVTADADAPDFFAGTAAPGSVFLHLTGPSAYEPALVPGSAPAPEEVPAEAAVLLDPEGALAGAAYTAEYACGDRISIRVSVTTSLSGDAGPVETPKLTKAVRIKDVRACEVMRRADTVFDSHTFLVESQRISASYAGGCVLEERSSGAADGVAQRLHFEQHFTFYGSDQSGGMTQDSWSRETYLADGIATEITDDGTETGEASFGDSYRKLWALSDYWPAVRELSDAELFDCGDCWLVEFTGGDVYGDFLRLDTVKALFDDSSVLDDLASAYATDSLTGYLSVDKLLGAPVALYLDYAGHHTIEGRDYPLTTRYNMIYLPFAGLAAAAGAAEDLPHRDVASPSPLFYEVTSPSGGKMWMLGTIHVGDERNDNLPAAVLDALDAADALAVECDIDAFTDSFDTDEAALERYRDVMFYSDDTRAEDEIADEELREDAVRAMKRFGQYFPAQMYSYKLFVWENLFTFSAQELARGLCSEYGVDNILIRRAHDAGKPVLDIEDVEEHLYLESTYPAELTELILEESVYSDSFLDGAALAELYEAWCRGDEAELTEQLTADEYTEDDIPEDATPEERERYLKEIELYRVYEEKLMTRRNQIMHEAALGYLDGGTTVFFAVGLAHLLGPDGLVQTLRDAGCTVELVR